MTETRVIVAHTADLDPRLREDARRLLYNAFDDMTDDDWEHALGGMHAIVLEDAHVIAHAAVIQRRIMHQGRALRTGYVEAVAVRADRRRRGHAASLMAKLERIIRDAYDIGALGASDMAKPFYESRGWQKWRGPSSALTPFGVVRTNEDDGGIYVLPVTLPLDLDEPIVCDWRGGDVW
jgi:aminoglycoside 2'-N-acetyltransferase I